MSGSLFLLKWISSSFKIGVLFGRFRAFIIEASTVIGEVGLETADAKEQEVFILIRTSA